MKGKKILAWVMAAAVFMTSGSIAFAAEEINTEDVPTCGTEEQTEGSFSYTVSNGQATLTKYNGTDETVVEIPEMVQGNIPVTAISSKLFYHNTKIEKIILSENLVSMGSDPEYVFLGTSNLKEIKVREGNNLLFDVDGVLFFYSPTNLKPVLLKYPEGKKDECYKIPNSVNYIKMYAFNKCNDLKKVIIPNSITTIFLGAFCELSDTKIIIQQINSSQITFVDAAFSNCNNCAVIVKNESMKNYVEQQISGKTPLYNCTNTTVKTESELKAELPETEWEKYLTPSTSLTFSDGSTVKDVTLMPEPDANYEGSFPSENEKGYDYYWQDIYYTVSPEYSTDIVTWISNNSDIAVAKSVNGRSVVMAFSDGEATITGTTESGKQITLNVTVQTPVDKTEIKYNGINNPETAITVQDEGTSNKSIYFRIYPCNATYRDNVTWESSNPEIISVKEYQKTQVDETYYSHKAKLTFNKPGTATITATLTDGSNVISQRSVTINVTKEEDVQNETETEENNDNAGANADAGNNTDSKDTGSNTGNGANGNKDSNTVKPAAKSSQKITNVSSSYKKAYKTSFTLKPKAKTSCTYKSSNTKIATVNSKGKLTIKGTGKVTITITAKETSKYKKATKKVTIYAIPAKMKTPSVKAGSKKLTVSWKKDSRADGYQIQYSTSSKFKNAKTVTCSKKTAKTIIKKLKKGKKYYVRIRAYKKIGSKKYYGSFSGTKKVKVK